jgi:hypothetical protein
MILDPSSPITKKQMVTMLAMNSLQKAPLAISGCESVQTAFAGRAGQFFVSWNCPRHNATSIRKSASTDQSAEAGR